MKSANPVYQAVPARLWTASGETMRVLSVLLLSACGSAATHGDGGSHHGSSSPSGTTDTATPGQDTSTTPGTTDSTTTPTGTSTSTSSSTVPDIPLGTLCFTVDGGPEECALPATITNVRSDHGSSIGFRATGQLTADPSSQVYVTGDVQATAPLPNTGGEYVILPIDGTCSHDATVDLGGGNYSCDRVDEDLLCPTDTDTGGAGELTIYAIDESEVLATFTSLYDGLTVDPCCVNDTLGCDTPTPETFDNPGPHVVTGRFHLSF